METESTARIGPTATTEWRAHWGLVFAAWFATSFVAVPSLSLGLFMEPLQEAFGWSRTQISSGLAVFAIVGTPLAPFAGALADRFGSRPVAIPGLLLSSLAFASFALMFGAFWLWIVLWVVYTLTQLLIRSMIWNRSISTAFNMSRGLAIAVVMSGSAIGQLATPLATEWLIRVFDWRIAYAALGLGWGGLALLATIILFREPGLPSSRDSKAEPPKSAGGLQVSEALRDTRILRIFVAVLLNTIFIMGLMVHLFPLLTGEGVLRSEAARHLALMGVAALVGQLLTGWLADRLSGSLLPVTCFAIPGFAYLAFLFGGGRAEALLVGVLLTGYGSAAALTIGVYLTTRYGGVRHFGKIAGLLSSVMGLGAGVGPLIAGAIFDISDSYYPFLIAGLVCAGMACLLIFRLGPYPQFGLRQSSGAGAAHGC